MKTGTAILPLHHGRVPRWLFEKMTKLAREISIILIEEFGAEEYLRKISDPYWFQAFGCVLGFDWHSSGVTTTVCGALKQGLSPIMNDLGLFICGGKGKTSRKTPTEIKAHTQNYHISIYEKKFVYASRMAAKVDNNALQDDYQLYHHTFFFTRAGEWAVVQQGMNQKNHFARRYHWLCDNVTDFVQEPHTAIASQAKTTPLNLVARESKKNRDTSAKLSHFKPEKITQQIKKLQEAKLPQRHHLLVSDINPKFLEKIFLKTYQDKPADFETLLGMKGVGAKTIRALSLISELIYGAPASTKDPARYSFAHGGKDGIPYPVDQKTYDKSIQILKEVINKAKLGHWEKLCAIKRLRS